MLVHQIHIVAFLFIVHIAEKYYICNAFYEGHAYNDPCMHS